MINLAKQVRMLIDSEGNFFAMLNKLSHTHSWT